MSTCECGFAHSGECERPASAATSAARFREARRSRNREAASAWVDQLTQGERDRLARDFERATREARFISARGWPSDKADRRPPTTGPEKCDESEASA